MTIGKFAVLPSAQAGHSVAPEKPGNGPSPNEAACAFQRGGTAQTAGSAVPDGQAPQAGPKIAFVRWLTSHPGRRPSDFQPLIKEAEFAFRCRAAVVPACNDLGGPTAMERHLRNLELGACCGWRVMTPGEARSLAAWLDAILLHHPWREAVTWRQSEARDSLIRHGEAEDGAPAADEPRRVIADAGLEDVLDHACALKSWRDAQNLVFAAWLGGRLLVDERGYLIANWKEAFAETLASKIEVQA